MHFLAIAAALSSYVAAALDTSIGFAAPEVAHESFALQSSDGTGTISYGYTGPSEITYFQLGHDNKDLFGIGNDDYDDPKAVYLDDELEVESYTLGVPASNGGAVTISAFDAAPATSLHCRLVGAKKGYKPSFPLKCAGPHGWHQFGNHGGILRFGTEKGIVKAGGTIVNLTAVFTS